MNILHVKYKSETGKSPIIGIDSEWFVTETKNVECYRCDEMNEVAVDINNGDFYSLEYIKWLEGQINTK